jgi:hypothetical protein
MAFALCGGIAFAAATNSGSIWAKGGVRLPVGCEDSTDVQQVPAPNGAARVEVRCGGLDPRRRVVLSITPRSGLPADVPIELEPGSAWRPLEVLWAPDSRRLVVNGSESGSAGNDFFIYHVAPKPSAAAKITAAAQRDMVQTFPPCKAAGLDHADCQRMAKNPQFNMSAVAWTRDSAALVVFAEVPCSSIFGGIMCQVMGYELDATTGRILTRMTAPELKRRYQAHLAWEMRIPEKPIWRR